MTGVEEHTAGARSARALAYGTAVIVVFGLQPFIAFYQANESQILSPGRVMLYALVTVSVALVVWVGAMLLARGRPPEALALVVAVFLLSFFNFSLWLSPDPRDTGTRLLQIVFWVVVTSTAGVLAYRLGQRPAFRTAALVFGAVFLAVPVAAAMSQTSPPSVAGDRVLPPVDTGAIDVRPNVYWFIVDSYGREDQLEAVLDFDNRDFGSSLEDRGFEVSTSSMGSYAHTHLSLGSTLAMTYRVLPGNELADPFDALGAVVRGDNETVQRFDELGYQYIYAPQGWLPWSSCDDDYVDICLAAKPTRLSVGEVELSLLDLTPLGSLDLLGLPYTDPVFVLDEFDEASIAVDEPFFLFAHVNTPHWPYRYDAGCRARQRPLDAQKLTLEERMTWYQQDIECVNPLMIEATDRIIADDPDAIVVIQSDHGSDFYSDWHVGPDGWDSGALNEHFAVLNAMRLPPNCDQSVEGEPLVNTFRLVFSCIEGAGHELLPWRAFLSPLDQTKELEELDPARFEPGTPAPLEE